MGLEVGGDASIDRDRVRTTWERPGICLRDTLQAQFYGLQSPVKRGRDTGVTDVAERFLNHNCKELFINTGQTRILLPSKA